MRIFTRYTEALILTVAIMLSVSFANAQQSTMKHPTPLEIQKAWQASPHADKSSESFTHWNKDGEIPGSCAVCHSTTGIKDYVAGQMSTPGIIDHPVPIGESVECGACHNEKAEALKSVPFPSGISVDTFGSSATCAVCHQGRASSITVNEATKEFDEDLVETELSFINVHYAPAAASLMGSVVKGGYEYEGEMYKGQFNHVPNVNQCTDCHNPHTLKVSLESCSTCHQNITSFNGIRTSPEDFDGDGNITEGIANPISSLHQMLGVAIQKYATEITKAPIIYSSNAYPYFFNDSNTDALLTDGEAIFPNRYQSWTPRLLKAAYNYQYVAKERGAHAHNPHYTLQLLYDSLKNLSERVEIDISSLTRPEVR